MRQLIEAMSPGPLDKIVKAIALLEEAAKDLLDSGESFYDQGDNFRGNIRHDAGRSLLQQITALRSSTSHLELALNKTPSGKK